MRRSYYVPAACLLTALLAAAATTAVAHEKGAWKKGYDISKTGLTPRYPANMRCSPLDFVLRKLGRRRRNAARSAAFRS